MAKKKNSDKDKMTTEEKYRLLLKNMGLMKFNPKHNSYYATFAAFGDSIPDEIWEEAKKEYKASELYCA